MRRLAFFLAFLAACGTRASQEPVTLRVGVLGPFGPFTSTNDSTSTTLAQDLVYETLFHPDGSALASRVFARWEHVGPGRLRALVADGLAFSDGSPVRTDDVAAAIAEAGLGVRRSGSWLEIEAVEKPSPPVEALLLPVVVHKATAAGDLGTRPFRLVSGDARHIVLQRVVPVRGRIARVELVAYESTRAAFADALKSGVNAAVSLDERLVELADGVPGLRVLRSRAPNALAVVFNARRLSPDARRAIAAALPVGEIGDVAQGKSCGPPSGRVAAVPLSPGPAIDVLTVASDPPSERAALAVRRSLGRRGGEVVSTTLQQMLGRLDRFDLHVSAPVVSPSAAAALQWRTGARFNFSGYSNPAYDAAVDAGDFARAEEALRADPPAIFLCRRERIAVVDARIARAELGEWGTLDTLPDWEVAE